MWQRFNPFNHQIKNFVLGFIAASIYQQIGEQTASGIFSFSFKQFICTEYKFYLSRGSSSAFVDKRRTKIKEKFRNTILLIFQNMKKKKTFKWKMIFRIHFSVLCPQFQTYLKKVTTIVTFWSTLRIFINFKLTFNCAVYFNPDTGFTNDEEW